MAIYSRNDAEELWMCLKETICRNAGNSLGTIATEVPGLEFHRHASPREAFPHFLRPVVIIVAQGKNKSGLAMSNTSMGKKCFWSPASTCQL